MDGRPTLTHCSLQCGITLSVAPDRVHLAPQDDFPINRGGLYSKGWNAAELFDHANITYDHIVDEQGVFWPCPNEKHPGTPQLFADRFATPDGRARFFPVEHRASRQSCQTRSIPITSGRNLLGGAADPWRRHHPGAATADRRRRRAL